MHTILCKQLTVKLRKTIINNQFDENSLISYRQPYIRELLTNNSYYEFNNS